MNMMNSYGCCCCCLLTILIRMLVTGSAMAGKKVDCLVNITIGYSDPKNVYQCVRPLNCCQEYSMPSCCGRKPGWQIVQEQVTLWGGLFAILFCLASIVYCRKKDVNIPWCVAIKHCLVRGCCGSPANTDATSPPSSFPLPERDSKKFNHHRHQEKFEEMKSLHIHPPINQAARNNNNQRVKQPKPAPSPSSKPWMRNNAVNPMIQMSQV